MNSILIAEPSGILAKALTQALHFRYEIHAACTLKDAASITEHLHPDILIIDLHMPPCGGIQFLQSMSCKPLLIIAITAIATDDILEDIYRAGAHRIILKPYSIHYLIKAIDESRKKAPTLGD